MSRRALAQNHPTVLCSHIAQKQSINNPGTVEFVKDGEILQLIENDNSSRHFATFPAKAESICTVEFFFETGAMPPCFHSRLYRRFACFGYQRRHIEREGCNGCFGRPPSTAWLSKAAILFFASASTKTCKAHLLTNVNANFSF